MPAERVLVIGDDAVLRREVRIVDWQTAGGLSLFRATDPPRFRPPAGSTAALYVALWQLDIPREGEEVVLCHLRRAAKIVASKVTIELRRAHGRRPTAAGVATRVRSRQLSIAERDEWGLVFYTHDAQGQPVVLPAIQAGHFNAWYVGGNVQGGPGMVHPMEAARWQGIGGGRREGQRAGRRFHIPFPRRIRLQGKALWETVGDGIYGGMSTALMQRAAACVHNVRRRTAGPGRVTGPIKYASLGTGAMDTNFHALRAVAGAVEHVLGAELQKARRTAMAVATTTAIAVADARESSQADRVREEWGAEVELLSVTYSCKKVTKGRFSKKGQSWGQRRTEAAVDMADAVYATVSYVRRVEPSVVVFEQAASLTTHFPGVWRWMRAQLEALPYQWEWGIFEAVHFGACNSRTRLLGVGERR